MYEHEEPINSQIPWTKGAIFFVPSGNEQGGVWFMSLNSAKDIIIKSWDTILMPDTVIDHANELDYNEPDQFIFTDHISCPIGDIDITSSDRDDSVSNKNQAPQDPPHNFQSIEPSEE